MIDYKSGYDPKYGYNRNAFAHKPLQLKILSRTIKMITTPIGLASEAIHTYRDKKRSQSISEAMETDTTEEASIEKTASPSKDQGDQGASVYVEAPADQAESLIASGQAVPADGETPTHELVPERDEDDGIERDEADWALDDAASEIEENEELDSIRNTDEEGHGASPQAARSNLAFPVILPQRRPGTKARGFVRAYAPVLQDSGIDEKAFLSFLKDFHRAAQASPVFDVVMVATAIVGVYPDIIVGATVQAIQIAAKIGQEAQERWRTNKFLDQANREIFAPKGLFALIITYKPGNSERAEIGTMTIDLGATAIAKYGDPLEKAQAAEAGGEEQEKSKRIDEVKEKMKRLRIASGETHGEAELPVNCAPLIFPALDAVADAATKEAGNESVAGNIKDKSKSASKFVSNYFDRRAQAVYAFENPDSTLTAQMAPVAPQFKSRFADPNNAVNTHLFTLITGGRYKAEPLGARRRWEKAQRKAAEKRAQGIKEKPAKRLLQENVLYLMVVNMPTEQELEKARKKMEEAKEKKAAARKTAQQQEGSSSS
ncbi:MAG: hypothetical protein MMC33_004404 [Icmadophila ericetorum]|nr:hypothetical protein [Icmadophila ericetorum]